MIYKIIIIGIIVSLDALFVSIASGLKYNSLNINKLLILPVSFGFFQFLMTFIGYIISNEINNVFKIYNVLRIVSSIVLFILGLKMIFIDSKDETNYVKDLRFSTILIMSLATSIDALSIGLTIFDYGFSIALLSSILIGLITFIICIIGVIIGKNIGYFLNRKAMIVGGLILIILSSSILFT